MKYAPLLLASIALYLTGCPSEKTETHPPLAGELTDVAVTGELSIEIRVFKKIFRPGETAKVFITARNNGSEPIEINATSAAPVFVQVERFTDAHWARVARYPQAAAMVMSPWTLKPGASRQWEMPIPVEPDWPAAEPLKLKAWLNGRADTTAAVEIEVAPEVE